jgi:V-type H+-transporting ATPase subunit d
MTTPAPKSSPGGMATFNILHAYPEALVRGMRSSFLMDSDYHHLTQVRNHLRVLSPLYLWTRLAQTWRGVSRDDVTRFIFIVSTEPSLIPFSFLSIKQCETLDDVRLNMSESDYAESLADMTSLAPTGLQKVAIEKVRATMTSASEQLPHSSRHIFT